MPVEYKIIPDQKIAYIRAWGKVTADEIMIEGARMFAESDWVNGYNILCDYREITELNIKIEDIERIVIQDKEHEPLFDQSKCAVVSTGDLIFGLSRMWETLSEDNKLERIIFRNFDDALGWLGIDIDVLRSIREQGAL